MSRDPNLDHAGVIVYRNVVHLTPNHIQRKDIAVTIDEWAKDIGVKRALDLWEQILLKFMLEGNNPKRVDWMMDRFESFARKMPRNGNGKH